MKFELTDDQIEIIGQALANHLEATEEHAKAAQSERVQQSYNAYAEAIKEARLAFYLRVLRVNGVGI